MSAELLSYRYHDGVHSLEGVLDETAAPVLAALGAALAPGAPITFELGGLRRINSLGVRAWCDFMKTLGGHALSLRRCSPAFVEQLNTVRGFAGHGRVESFLAPYACETSGKTFYPELVVGRDVEAGALDALGPRPCTECKDPMLFDDVPERYLGFLANR